MPIRTARDGQATGVWELQALQAALDRGEVLPTDLVWSNGFPDWRPLADAGRDIGLVMPSVNEAPPIPSPNSVAPPPIPKSAANPLAATSRSDPQDIGELKFRARERSKRYGFSASTKAAFLVMLLGGGWLLANYGLPALNERWRANFNATSSTDAGMVDSANTQSSEPNTTSGNGAEQRVDPRCLGKVFTVSAKLGNDSYQRVKFAYGWIAEELVRRGQFHVSSAVVTRTSSDSVICEGTFDIEGSVDGNSFNRQGLLMHWGVFLPASSTQEAPEPVASTDSGNSECVEISRRWAEARRKADALEGTPAGGFATIELARIENVERVFAGCKGSESREEQEYLQQHPGYRNVQQHPGYRNGIRSAGSRCPMPEADNAEPKACVTRPPMYPREEQRRGIQGTAVVIAHLDEQGAVRDVELEVSSGNRNLDREALKAVSGYSFSPLIEDGQPKSTRLRMPMTFSLVNAPNNDVQVADSNEAGTEPNQEPSTDDTAESQ